MSPPSECEGLWGLIVSAAIEAERDEIARIIGSKRINDNQTLWQEVKAYNDILSGMYMLEFEDLEERFAPSKDNSSSCGKEQAKSATSSSTGAVPPLTLQGGKTSKISSTIPGAENQHRAAGLGKKGSSSNAANNGNRDEAKSSSSSSKHYGGAQAQANSPGAMSPRSSSSSSGSGGSSYGHKYNDATDFVVSIQEYLTIDRIAAVLDDIKEAFETERYELVGKRRQLECIMESDCDAISTNRSGGKSNKSTPRSDRGGTGPVAGLHHELLPMKSKQRSFGRSNGFWEEEEDERSVGSKARSVPQCSACGGDVGDYLQLQEQHLSAVPGAKSVSSSTLVGKGSSSSSSSSRNGSGGNSSRNGSGGNSSRNGSGGNSGTDMCLDCRARSQREKKLLSRLPKGMTASSAVTAAVSHSQEFKSDASFLSEEQPPVQHGMGAMSKRDNSKFRNRLQAARDEHHFIEDF